MTHPSACSLQNSEEAVAGFPPREVDESDFRAQIRISLNELDLTLIELEDVETMEARLSKFHVHRDLRRLAAEAKRTGSPQFDTFHAFDSTGAAPIPSK